MQQWPHVAVRPHIKAHKCADIARLQLAALGATGVCCQKVAEAEAMAEGGLDDLLLTNEVVAPRKIARLVGLAAAGAKVGVCIDNEDALRKLAKEASAQGTSVDVLVDVNVGQDRCGVDTDDEVVRLASIAASLDAVRFVGLQAYHGGIQHVRQPKDRAVKVGAVVKRAAEAVKALEAAGLKPGVVTGGGTGSYRIEAASGVFTEVQPGSFCFNDADYARNVMEDGRHGGWEQSLWVLTQVMSRNVSRGLAVVDAGTKAVSLDSGPPVLPTTASHGLQVEYVSGGDEHGKLLWPLDGAVHSLGPLDTLLPPVGALLQLQPGHCDPTVNLYDWIVAVRSEVVVAVWAIRGRGPGQ